MHAVEAVMSKRCVVCAERRRRRDPRDPHALAFFSAICVVCYRLASSTELPIAVWSARQARRCERRRARSAKLLTWRRLEGREYKSCWCTLCAAHHNNAGVWAHWERSDGLTVCGEFHKPEDCDSFDAKGKPAA